MPHHKSRLLIDNSMAMGTRRIFLTDGQSRSLGTKVPSGVQEWSPRCGYGGKAPGSRREVV